MGECGTTFKLVLEYDGAAFAGWQRQAQGETTVQGCLESALARVTGGGRVRVTGAGRTDAGVHAQGQVASVTVETALGPERLQAALNATLPAAAVVRRLCVADAGFDARRDALAKLYRYALWNGPVRSPLRAPRSYRVPQPLDLAAMQQAAAALVGEHDFSSFQAAGSAVRTSVRHILRCEVRGRPEAALAIDVEGTGFLRHMVRNIAGTLVEVGLGRRPAGSMPALIESRERSQAGPTAPAHGLTLVVVRYPGEPAAGEAAKGE